MPLVAAVAAAGLGLWFAAQLSPLFVSYFTPWAFVTFTSASRLMIRSNMMGWIMFAKGPRVSPGTSGEALSRFRDATLHIQTIHAMGEAHRTTAAGFAARLLSAGIEVEVGGGELLLAAGAGALAAGAAASDLDSVAGAGAELPPLPPRKSVTYQPDPLS